MEEPSSFFVSRNGKIMKLWKLSEKDKRIGYILKDETDGMKDRGMLIELR